jgi:hypothetical protein
MNTKRRFAKNEFQGPNLIKVFNILPFYFSVPITKYEKAAILQT